MNSQLVKRSLSMLLALIMVFSAIPVSAFAELVEAEGTQMIETVTENSIVEADGNTAAIGGVTISADEKDTLTVNEGVVTVTVTSTRTQPKTTAITVENTTDSPLAVSFNYVTSGDVATEGWKLDGSILEKTGTFQATMIAAETREFTLTAPNGIKTATVILSDFAVSGISSESTVTVKYDPALGGVTAGGLDDGDADGQIVVEKVGTSGVSVAATPEPGVTFLGWVDTATNLLKSTNAIDTIPVTGDTTLRAAFVHPDKNVWFKVGSQYTDDLNKATTLGSTIVPVTDGTLAAGNYTIPKGVTLLIPFDDANTLYTDEPEHADQILYTMPYAYRTLTMEKGANIVINGAMSVSGQFTYTNSAGQSGSPSGPLGFVEMKKGSNITVNNGGNLYAWGYIIGSGTVTANSGATVYENLQLPEYRGTSQATNIDNAVFPMSQFYVQNIEVPLTLYSGATEKTYASIYASGGYLSTGFTLFGNGGLFQLSSGYVTKWYDSTKDRLHIEINGTSTMNSFELVVGEGWLSGSIDTADYVLPINGGFTITLKSGSSLTIPSDQRVLLQPGAQLIIDEGANCTVNSALYVYDAAEWGAYCFYGHRNASDSNIWDTPVMPVTYSPTRTYVRPTVFPDSSPYPNPTTQAQYLANYTADTGDYISASALAAFLETLPDASILVNGSLTGNIYTTAGGANIYSTGNGTFTQKATGSSNVYQLMMRYGDASGEGSLQYVSAASTRAQLMNEDKSHVTGETAIYHYAHGLWHKGDTAPTVTSTNTPTCTEGVQTTVTCSVCGNIESDLDALGHDWSAWTEVDENTRYRSCSRCGLEKTYKRLSLPMEYTGEVYVDYNAGGVYYGTRNVLDVLGIKDGTYTNDEVTITINGNTIKVDGTPTATTNFDLQEGDFAVDLTRDPGYMLPDGDYRIGLTGSGTYPIFHIRHTDGNNSVVATQSLKTLTGLSNFGVPFLRLNANTTYSFTGKMYVIMGSDSSYDSDVPQTEKIDSTGIYETDGFVWSPSTDTEVFGEVPADNPCYFGHTVVTDEAVEATCTTDGKTEGSHCSVCDEVIVAQEVIPATHTLTTDEVDEDTRHVTCSKCGLDKTFKRMTLPLDYSGYVYVENNTEGVYYGTRNVLDVMGIKDGEYTNGEVTIIINGNELTVTGTPTSEVRFDLQAGTFGVTYVKDLGYVLPDGDYRIGLTGSGTLPIFHIRTSNGGNNLVAVQSMKTFTGLTGANFGVPFLRLTANTTYNFTGKMYVNLGSDSSYDSDVPQTEKIDSTGIYETDGFVWSPSTDTEVFGEVPADDPCFFGHTVVIDAAVEATCTTDGKTEGSHCSVCNAVIVAQEVIPAGHDLTVDEVDENTRHVTCSVCKLDKIYKRMSLPLDYSGEVYVENNTDGVYYGTRSVLDVMGIHDVEYSDDNVTITIKGNEVTITGTVSTATYFDLQTGGFGTSARDHGYKLPDGDYRIGLTRSAGDGTFPGFFIRKPGGGSNYVSVTGLKTLTEQIGANFGIPYLYLYAGTYNFTGKIYANLGSDSNYDNDIPVTEKIDSNGVYEVDGFLWTSGTDTAVFGETPADDPCYFGHTVVIDAAVEATCTTDGKTEGSHCSVCNAVIVAQEVIPATHTLTTDEVDEDTRHVTCSKCGLDKTFKRMSLPLEYHGDVYVENNTDGVYYGTRSVLDVMGIHDVEYSDDNVTITIKGNEVTIDGTVSSNTYFDLQTGTFGTSKRDPGYALPDGDYRIGLTGSAGDGKFPGLFIRYLDNSQPYVATTGLGTRAGLIGANFGIPYLYLYAGEYDFAGKMYVNLGADSNYDNDVPQTKKSDSNGVFKVGGFLWTPGTDTAVFGEVLSNGAGKLIYTEGVNEYINIYLPKESGFQQIQMNFVDDDSVNAYGWRLNMMYACDDTLAQLFPITYPGEYEAAIKMNGRPDFMGMGAHGSERMTSFAIYVNGEKVALEELTEMTDWNTIQIRRESDFYDPSDETTKVATHTVVYDFDLTGLTVTQEVNWLVADTCVGSFMMMFPVRRTYESLQITDTYFDDYDKTEYDVSQAGFTTYPVQWTHGATKMTAYSTKSGITATMQNISSTQLNGSGYKQLSSADTYNKMYITICGGAGLAQTVAVGDKWETTTRYEVTIEKGTEVDCFLGHKNGAVSGTVSEVTTAPTFDTRGVGKVICEFCGKVVENCEFYCAQIGDTKYLTVKDALEAAKATDIIEILANISDKIPVSQEVTFAVNGHTADIEAGTGFNAITNTGNGTVKVTAVQAVLDALSLDIRSEVQMNFLFYIPADWTDAKIIISEEDNNIVNYPDSEEISLSDLSQDSKGRYVVSRGIAAGEMTGDVTVQVKHNGTAQLIYDAKTKEESTSVVYTIQDCAQRIFDMAEANPDNARYQAFKDMTAAMLVFGRYAQEFYQTHTGKLADSILAANNIESPNLTKVDNSTLEELLRDNVGDNDVEIGIKVSSQLADLDSDVKLRVYFTLTNETEWESYKFAVTGPARNGTGEGTVKPTLNLEEVVSGETSQTYYYLELDVPPAYWNDIYTIKVTKGENTDNVYTVKTSVMAWVYSCIKNNANSTDKKLLAESNMAKAMYYYSQLADEYFLLKGQDAQ